MTVVSLVVRALGTPAKALEKRLKNIGIETKITELQKHVLIPTSRIPWKVLELWGVLLTRYLKIKSYLLVKTNVRLFNNNNNNNNNDDNNNSNNNNNNNSNNDNEKKLSTCFAVFMFSKFIYD